MSGVDALYVRKAANAPQSREAASDEARRASDLLARYQRDVDRLVRHLLGPDRDHEDIVQDVFVRLMTGWRSLREPERERAWVATVTVNLVRNHLRRRKVRRIVELRPEPPEQTLHTEPHLLVRDLARRCYALLDRLRPADRIALILRRAEERSIEEVAELCDCSAATIKRRVRRAEQQLEALLEEDADLRAHVRGEVRSEHDDQ